MAATLLVIPCYRERERLPRFLPGLCQALAGMEHVRVRAVDDGSGPEHQAWLDTYIASLRGGFPQLEPAQLNPLNLGKGGAVYSAWDRAAGAEHLAFVDADGAVPPGEVARLLALAGSRPGSAFYAVRTGTRGTRVQRSPLRRLAGWAFRRLVRRYFDFPVPDTQCGCKLVPASAFAAFRTQLQELRYTFDVELTWHLLRHGVKIETLPVNWSEQPGGHLRPAGVRDMFRALRALRRRLGSWRAAGS